MPLTESAIEAIAPSIVTFQYLLHKCHRASDSESFKWSLTESSESLASWLALACLPIIAFMRVLDMPQFQTMAKPYICPVTMGALSAFVKFSLMLPLRLYLLKDSKELDAIVHSVRDDAGDYIITWLEEVMGSLRIDVTSTEEKRKWQVRFHMVVGATLAICLSTDKVLVKPSKMRPNYR